MARTPRNPPAAPPAEDWNEAPEASENTEAADAARRAEAGAGSGIMQAGPALTDAQLDGLDPIDAETHLDEAARRADLTNGQTEHEALNALDAVSGTPNPGITADHNHSAPGVLGASDMSGNAARPDPLKAIDRATINEAKRVLDKAEAQDIANGKDGNEDATRRSAGWRSLADLGVHKATMDALVKADMVEVGSAPGMSHFPETGRLYRVKKDRG